METAIEFWNRVDDLRGRMSVRELAERSNISEGSFQTTRAMKTLPKLPFVYSVAKALGTTVEYLYTGIKEDYDDLPLFRRISASQDLIDICEALVCGTKEDIELVKRVLGLKRALAGGLSEALA